MQALMPRTNSPVMSANARLSMACGSGVLERALAPVSPEEILHELVIQSADGRERIAGDYMLVRQYRDPVGQLEERVQVVRDHDHGEAVLAAQLLDQVEIGRASCRERV